MRIDVILSTFNRPRLLKVAIDSILGQTSKDWELWVLDDGSSYDFKKQIILPYKDSRIHFFQGEKLKLSERYAGSRISFLVNYLLDRSSNELVSYLCDDDYYWPEAIGGVIDFFKNHPEVNVGFGKLTYSHSESDERPREKRELRYFENPIMPFNKLDHNQVIHRRECLKYVKWPGSGFPWPLGPDAFFFSELSKMYTFYPINVWFSNKLLHPHNVQQLKHLEQLEVRE